MNDLAAEFQATPSSNHLADYMNAFRAGESLATPRPDGANALGRFTNAVTGRLALANSAQKDQAARRAELLDALGTGLAGVPYAQRISVLTHLAPALEAEGIPPRVVSSFDPTDEALAISVDQARAAKALIHTS